MRGQDDTDDDIVILLGDDDATTDQQPSTSSRAPPRPAKKATASSNYVLDELTSTRDQGDLTKCPKCAKDMSRLDATRKAIHLEACLSDEDAMAKFEAELKKHANTVDCPMCGQSLAPGPFRIAHVKACGNKHGISGVDLLKLWSTTEKCTKERRKNGQAHTKKPVPQPRPAKVRKLNGEPKSLEEQELAMAIALSLSESTANVSESPARPTELRYISPPTDSKLKPLSVAQGQGVKRKARGRLSYEFVEYEPQKCRCRVYDTVLHSFKSRFVVRRSNSTKQSVVEVAKRRESRTTEWARYWEPKTKRLECAERIIDDVWRAQVSGKYTDVTLLADDGLKIPAHKVFLAARTRGLAEKVNRDGFVPIRGAAGTSVRSWLRFVYTAKMEWSEEEIPEILALAQMHGPHELLAILTAASSEEKVVEDDVREAKEESRSKEVEKESLPNRTVGEKAVAKEENAQEPAAEGREAFDSFAEVTWQHTDAGGLEPVVDETVVATTTPTKRTSSGKPHKNDSSVATPPLVRLPESVTKIQPGLTPLPRITRRSTMMEKVLENRSIVEKAVAEEENAQEPVAVGQEAFDSFNEATWQHADVGNLEPIVDEVLVAVTPGRRSSSRSKPSLARLPKSATKVATQALPESTPKTMRRSLSTANITEDHQQQQQRKKTGKPTMARHRSASNVVAAQQKPVLTSSKTPRLAVLPPDARILKQGNAVTPRPVFADMPDDWLKAELAKRGLDSKISRKRAIVLLERCYDATHVRIGKEEEEEAKDGEERDDDDGDGDEDRTLNESDDEREADRLEEHEEEGVDSDGEDSDFKGNEAVRIRLVRWLYDEPTNGRLLDHLLSLQPIVFEDMYERVSRQAPFTITRRALRDVLDELAVSAQMPNDRFHGGGGGGGGAGSKRTQGEKNPLWDG